jgi:hypothetical protein
MTVNSEVRVAGPFVATGVSQVIPFTVRIFNANDIVVYVTDLAGANTRLTNQTGFTVSKNVDQDASPGGTVTITATLNYTITLTTELANTQGVTLSNLGGFYPTVITDALDRLTILIQQAAVNTSRSLKFPVSDSTSLTTELPSALVRANKTLGFDASGNVVAGSVSTTVVSAAMIPVVQAATINAAYNLLVLASSITTAKIADANVTTAKIADANVTTAKIADNNVTPAKLANSGLELGAFRNKIINGAFDIWQSGTSISSGVSANTYTADQWIAFAVGAAVTVSQSSGGGFTAGTNCLLFTGAASNTYVDLIQRFEAAEVQKFKNGNITVSARIFNGTGSTIAANSLTFTVSCPTATDNWAGANQRLGTTLTHAAISNATWGQVSITFNPSGYTDIDKGMSVAFRFNALLAGQTIRVSEVQLEAGATITPYEQRSVAAERFLCMKFYQTIGRGIWGWLNAASSASFNVVFAVPMRTSPTVSFLVPAWLIYRNIGNSNFPAPLTIVDAANDTTGMRMTFSHGGSGGVNELWGSIQSDVIALNARL